MAGRGHVDVKERRLRPIYDCLDNGNNKKAIQEADKVLRKQDDLLCAKALKALALLRLGRHDDSSALLSNVHNSNPTDDATLQAMALGYRETHRLDLIADMYERANREKPNSEEILTSLFMAFVRLGDYKKQQQVAMQLHRLRPAKNPYYFWAIMSIYMQACNADPKMQQGVFLPLAERMARKYVEEDKIEAEAELRMFLIILELQGKKKEALELIQGDLAKRYCSELRYNQSKAGELLKDLEKWPEMNAVYRKLICAEPDQWLFYMEYFTSAFHLVEENWQPPAENDADADGEDCDHVIDFTLERVAAFLQEPKQAKPQTQSEREDKPKALRSENLAKLEFLKRLKESGKEYPEDCWGLGSASSLIQQYFSLFGDKPCCFSDLKLYMSSLLDQTQQKEMLKSFLTELNMASEEKVFPSDVRMMLRHLNVVQMEQYLGFYDNRSLVEKEEVIQDLLARHSHGLQFGESLLATDFQPCDPYMLMAVHVMCDIWQETGDQSFCWQGILLLESALKKSPSNFHFKLLLIRLYTALGAFGPCRALFESLDIKHVQNDSLGYVIANHIGRLGHLSSAGTLYDTMLEFFTLNHKDTAEYMISAYKFGAFHKINEFLEFKTRLQNSMQYACATVERLLLDIAKETNSHEKTERILHYMEIDPEKDKTVWSDLRDNRDLDVWLHWLPPARALSPEDAERSFREEAAWLRVRNLLVRMVAAVVQMGSRGGPHASNNNIAADNGEKRSMGDVLRDLIAQFTQHLETCSKEYSQPAEYPLLGPFRTRLSTYLKLNLGELVAEALQTALYVHQLCANGSGKVDEQQELRLKSTVTDKLQALITSCHRPVINTEQNQKHFHVDVLEEMVLITELVGQLLIITGVCHQFLKPLKLSLTKQKKKKKQASNIEMPVTFSTFASHLTNMESAIESLQRSVKELNPAELSLDISSLSLTESGESHLTAYIQADQEKKMWQDIQSSYQQSSKELSDYLALKIQYLHSLKL